MKKQQKPFVVEIRQKRGAPKRSHSIWSDVDLAAAANAVRSEASETLPRANMAEELSPVLVSTRQEDAQVQTPDIRDDHPQTASVEPEISEVWETAVSHEEVTQSVSVAPISRRPRHEVQLPRGERWKWRLPKVLQSSELRLIRWSVARKRGRSC